MVFKGVPLPNAEGRDTSVGHLLLSSLKPQLGPTPLVAQISKNWPAAHELVGRTNRRASQAFPRELLRAKCSFTSNLPCNSLVGSALGKQCSCQNTRQKYPKSEEIIGEEAQFGLTGTSSARLMALTGLTRLV